MSRMRWILLWIPALAIGLGGCDELPGKPKPRQEWQPASAITDFDTLYRNNCLACHSNGETMSAGRSMNDPVFLAVLGQNNLRDLIANGIPGTAMPAFATKHGGELTDEQIEVLTKGIMAWKKGAALPSVPLPPYRAQLGDVAQGGEAFAVFCASCHGPEGKGGPNVSGSIVDPAYLGLVSDQALRSAVIAGRKDLGMGDWTSYVPNRAMTDQEIADVVAWLAAQRPTAPSTLSPNNPTTQP